MFAPWPVLQQVLSTRRSDDDALWAAIAAAALAAAIACVVFGVRLYRRKQVGVAVLLFLVGSALLFIAQFAWH